MCPENEVYDIQVAFFPATFRMICRTTCSRLELESNRGWLDLVAPLEWFFGLGNAWSMETEIYSAISSSCSTHDDDDDDESDDDGDDELLPSVLFRPGQFMAD